MDSEAVAATFTSAAVDALSHYPLAARSVELVSLSENVTFRVDALDGASYVLRLHRPGYHSLPELSSERVWLRALAEAGIAAPVPVTATDGRDYVPVRVAGIGEHRFAGVTHWIEGEIVASILGEASDISLVERCFAQLGSLMAALHNQASGWSPPPSYTRHSLDADGLMGEAPFWGRFWEHPELSKPERDVLVAARDAIYQAMERYGQDPATFSMIHADLHHSNLLVNGNQLTVIDFDDAGWGWHQYDMAVTLFHSMESPNFEAARRAFFDGYRSQRAISDQALALVPMFQLVRGLAIIGWKHQRPEVEWPPGAFDSVKTWVLTECASFEPPC
jgi:Ser/Thr protein kinase RdoA (MazF antagonist)